MPARIVEKILAVLASFIGLLLVTHSDSMISTASTVVASLTTDGTTLPDRRPKNAEYGENLGARKRLDADHPAESEREEALSL
jgi:hypothetical protein